MRSSASRRGRRTHPPRTHGAHAPQPQGPRRPRGVALGFHHLRSDVATGHRVSPRPTSAPPPAPSHAPRRPTAAHGSSPPAHNTGPVPPATDAVVGHCRTPYAVSPVTQPKGTPAATARPISPWASLGPVVLWCGRPPLPAHQLPAAAPSPPPSPGVDRVPGPGRPRRDGCHRPRTL